MANSSTCLGIVDDKCIKFLTRDYQAAHDFLFNHGLRPRPGSKGWIGDGRHGSITMGEDGRWLAAYRYDDRYKMTASRRPPARSLPPQQPSSFEELAQMIEGREVEIDVKVYRTFEEFARAFLSDFESHHGEDHDAS